MPASGAELPPVPFKAQVRCPPDPDLGMPAFGTGGGEGDLFGQDGRSGV